MLTYRRPHGSTTETAFIKRYIANLPGAYQDACQNWHVHVAKASGEDVKVLFSCHTDTVSWKQGRQDVRISNDGLGTISLGRRDKKRSNCLGADDTVGVFLCREMILAGIPGHYIFHFGEEVGGIGSSDLARTMPGVLAGYKYAIAFDRRGTRDIITHQGGRCASDDFASALADQLNAIQPCFFYKKCDGGIYTDTAEYTGLIPECTNVSVGYYYEHSSDEYVDGVHVLMLLDALKRVDYDLLPVDRNVKDVDDEFNYMFERQAVNANRVQERKDTKYKDVWERLWKDIDDRAHTSRDDDWPPATRDRRDDAPDVAPPGKKRRLRRWYQTGVGDGPEYIDPEWEEIQRVLTKAELGKLVH